MSPPRSKASSISHKPAATPSRTSSGRSTRVQAAPKKFPLWILGVAGGALLLIIVVVIAAGSGSSGSGDADRGKKHGSPSGKKKGDTKKTKDPAEKAWEDAQAYDKKHYDDLKSVKERYQKALSAARGSSYEEKIRKRIEEIDAQSLNQAEAAFAELKENATRFLEMKDFDAALALYDDVSRFQDHVSIMDRAMEDRTNVLYLKEKWNEARVYPADRIKKTLSSVQKIAYLSLQADAKFGLEKAPFQNPLTDWTPFGEASWKVEGDILRGVAEPGPGEIRFGNKDWKDYVFDFEYQIVKGKEFRILVHTEGEPNLIGMPSESWKPGEWFHARVVVWGAYMYIRVYQHISQKFGGFFEATEKSHIGGFAFHLTQKGTEVLFRDVRTRRLTTADKPFNPLPVRWFPVYEPERDMANASLDAEEGAKGNWGLRSGNLVGESDTGGWFLTLGSPSWTRYEFRFAVKNITQGLTIKAHRPPNLRELLEGKFLFASLTVPSHVASDGSWHKVHLILDEDKASISVDGKEIDSAGLKPMTTTKILSPVHIGFTRGQAGGRAELRDLEIRVQERGGGF